MRIKDIIQRLEQVKAEIEDTKIGNTIDINLYQEQLALEQLLK